jgi:hypothetical protein
VRCISTTLFQPTVLFHRDGDILWQEEVVSYGNGFSQGCEPRDGLCDELGASEGSRVLLLGVITVLVTES